MFIAHNSAQLAQIGLPTLNLHGDLETIVPLTDSEYIASQVSNSCPHMIKDAGHVPTMTRPREVAQEIHQYFSEQ